MWHTSQCICLHVHVSCLYAFMYTYVAFMHLLYNLLSKQVILSDNNPVSTYVNHLKLVLVVRIAALTSHAFKLNFCSTYLRNYLHTSFPGNLYYCGITMILLFVPCQEEVTGRYTICVQCKSLKNRCRSWLDGISLSAWET